MSVTENHKDRSGEALPGRREDDRVASAAQPPRGALRQSLTRAYATTSAERGAADDDPYADVPCTD